MSKYAREAAEFVNLYSKSRGINRFPALDRDARVAAEAARGAGPRRRRSRCPRAWSSGSSAKPSSPTRRWPKRSEATGDPDLKQALAWSKAVNETDRKDRPRRAAVSVSCASAWKSSTAKADLLVVSATPNEALKREWEEHDLAKYVAAICGQEIGTKKESLAVAKKYPPHHTLMIGDAPGDYKAARANNALVLPDQSRRTKKPVGSDCTTKGSTASSPARSPASIKQKLLAEFDTYLPEQPPWKR